MGRKQITCDKQSNISLVNSVAYRNGVAVGYESLQAWSFLSRWTDGFDGGCNKEQGSFGYREGGHDLMTRAHAHSHSLHSVLVRRVRRQFWVGTTRADRHLYPYNRPRPMSMQGMPETIHSNYSAPSPCCWLLSVLWESGSARPDRSLLWHPARGDLHSTGNNLERQQNPISTCTELQDIVSQGHK